MPAIRGKRSAATCPPISAFAIDVHAHEPETIYVVPIKSDSEHYPPEGKLRVYRSRTGGNEWEALTKGLPQTRLLRQRPARRDGGRFARLVRRVFRHDRRDRCMPRPIPAIIGRPLSAICRRCFRSRCRRCHDPSRSSAPSANAGAGRRSRSVWKLKDRSPACGARRARRTLSHAAWHHPRSRYAPAAALPALLRLPGGSISGSARHAFAGGHCVGCRALLHSGSIGWRIIGGCYGDVIRSWHRHHRSTRPTLRDPRVVFRAQAGRRDSRTASKAACGDTAPKRSKLANFGRPQPKCSST